MKRSFPMSTLWLAFLAVLASLFVSWSTNRVQVARVATMDDVRTEAEKGGYRLIDLQELVTLYESRRDQVLLIDTRQEWEYRSGHIAGAVVFPMEPTWRARWLKRTELKDLLGQDKDKTIVFY
jgi:3-mercaptopyruvate sulfurtransferase SseA